MRNPMVAYNRRIDHELLPKVERSVDLVVPPDLAWSHLINGELASLWIGGTMAIEPRVGGKVYLATDG
ncbi:MAG: hypothetical protein ACRDVK_10050, partial [Acidimicrobiia bacterium]